MPPARIEFNTNIGRRKIFNILQFNQVTELDFNEDFKIHGRLFPVADPKSLGAQICKGLHNKLERNSVQRLSRNLKKERLYYKKMFQENWYLLFCYYYFE